MRAPRTDLPAPAGGMNSAARPTGIVLGVIVFVAAFAATSIVPAIVMPQVLTATGMPPMVLHGIADLVSLLSCVLGLLLLWVWLRAKERRPFASLGFARSEGRSWVVLAARGLGIGVAMIAFCVLVPVALGQARLVWANPTGTNLAFILAMLLAFLVQGSTEEILTRGYLTQVVARRWGLIAAIVVQALFFALLHGANSGLGVLPVVNLLVFALFASMYSLAEGSLWGISAMHGIWNWAQGSLFGAIVSGDLVAHSFFISLPLPDTPDLLTGGAFGIEGSLVTTTVFLVGALVAWLRFRARRARTRIDRVGVVSGF